jgi:hypothetical protein
VRYDTTTWHGFMFSAAWGENDFWDVAVRYSGEWHGWRVAAGAGYRSYRDREPDVVVLGPPATKLSDTDRHHWLTSASVMHVASGLFVSAAYTRYEWFGFNANEVIGGVPANGNRPDIPLWWIGGGIQRNWTGWPTHSTASTAGSGTARSGCWGRRRIRASGPSPTVRSNPAPSWPTAR